MLNIAYIFHRSIIFKIIPEHTDAFFPSLHEIKNTFMAEMQLLHMQPFMNRNFHFHITVKLATSQVLCDLSVL